QQPFVYGSLSREAIYLKPGPSGQPGPPVTQPPVVIALPPSGPITVPPPLPDPAHGLIFPDSDRRYLTRDDLRRLSREQLRIARNEIYARKGRYFQDANLKAYFSRFSWYRPTTWDVTLNAVEQANVTLIQSLER